MSMFEYNGFCLKMTSDWENVDASWIAECSELNYKATNDSWDVLISGFKQCVDSVLKKKVFSYSDSKKELDRMTKLLKEEPTVFYGTNQVYDLITLCEDCLVFAKQKEESVKRDKIREGYYQELNKLREKVKNSRMSIHDLRYQLNEIWALFYKLLDLKPDDVVRDYFECAE